VWVEKFQENLRETLNFVADITTYF